jgi:hypothetical protein
MSDTYTIPIATVKTWAGAQRYMLDITDGERISYGVGNRYPERWTATRAWGGFGYDLHRNTGNGELGPIVHHVMVNPQTGIDY